MANTPFRKPKRPVQPTSVHYTPAQAAPLNAPRTITAAAARMDLSNRSEAERLAERQGRRVSFIQSAAWEYYDAISEIKYALGMVSSIVSRIRLYCAVQEDPADPTPVAVRDAHTIPADLAEAAERTLGRLNSAYGGQAGLLRDAALNISVAGECYLVQVPATVGTKREESWDIRSVDELKVTRDGEYVILPRSDMAYTSSGALPKGAIKLPKEAFAGRIWKAHPRFCILPSTEVYTRRGWLTYDQLTAEDEAYTLDHNTGSGVWSKIRRVNVFEVENEPMLKIDRQGHSSMTTMEHRWPVLGRRSGTRKREWTTSAHLRSDDQVPISAQYAGIPVEKTYSDEFVELLGWYWTEGTLVTPRLGHGARTIGKLVDPVAWEQFVSNARQTAGKSLAMVGAQMGVDNKARAQQKAADLQRKGAARFTERTQLAAVLEVAPDSLHEFYNHRDRSSHITICQSRVANPDKVNRIRGALTRMLGPADKSRMKAGGAHELHSAAWVEHQDRDMIVFTLNAAASAGFLSATGSRKDKVVSLEVIDKFTESQLDLFINTSLAADGHVTSEGVPTLAQAAHSSQRLDALERAATLRGIATTRTSNDSVTTLTFRKRHTLCPTSESDKVTTESYTGAVWCPTTDTGTWLARENGRVFFTGNSEDPDSSLFGMLDLCEELLLLDRTFRATHRSRLNAGLLYIPDVLSSSAGPDANLFEQGTEPEASPEDEADEFEEQLLLGMSTPIEDESSASAVVPIIIRGPADLADKVKPIKLERSFDENMVQRADRVLERIMQGLDVPKDTVTGLANVKYSNAIQIDEALYKAHIEPMLLLLADAFTVMYLRPALLDLKFPKNEVDRIVVWYDPSSVATRNDRAADADSGFEKGAISYETWRKAHGFSDQDAPTQTEALTRLVLDKGTLTPELTEALLAVISPEMMTAAKGVAQANSVAPVPTAAQDILNGGTGQVAEGLETPAEDLPTDEAPPVQPGQDAPPFELEEPDSSISDEDAV